MAINALEATDGEKPVRVWAEKGDPGPISFHVWNHRYIPEPVALRVFQRNFTTKEGGGRGIGTFSMKFFGEDVLGGRVHFTTDEEEGTTFVFTLP